MALGFRQCRITTFQPIHIHIMMVNAPMRWFSPIIDTKGGSVDSAESEAAAKASAKEFLGKVEEDLIIDEVTTIE